MPTWNGENMQPRKYRVGDRIVYRPDFGSGPQTEVTITGLGHKNDKHVYDLDNGRWCYEDSIDRKVKGAIYAVADKSRE